MKQQVNYALLESNLIKKYQPYTIGALKNKSIFFSLNKSEPTWSVEICSKAHRAFSRLNHLVFIK